MILTHFHQPCVAICPVNRSDECPHDRTLPFDQRRPTCATIRFILTASLGENGFVYHPSGFMRGGGPAIEPAARRSGDRSDALFARVATVAKIGKRLNGAV